MYSRSLSTQLTSNPGLDRDFRGMQDLVKRPVNIGFNHIEDLIEEPAGRIAPTTDRKAALRSVKQQNGNNSSFSSFGPQPTLVE
jgi:hypothetical protein